MEGVSSDPRDVCVLTLRKRRENGTSPPSKESTKLMNNLPGCCTASAHGVSLNVVETIVLGTQAQREEDARAGPTAPPLSDGMLSAMTGGGQTWTDKVVKDKYTSETRCASLKSWTASVAEGVWRGVPRAPQAED